jgi:hypothetical protein
MLMMDIGPKRILLVKARGNTAGKEGNSRGVSKLVVVVVRQRICCASRNSQDARVSTTAWMARNDSYGHLCLKRRALVLSEGGDSDDVNLCSDSAYVLL